MEHNSLNCQAISNVSGSSRGQTRGGSDPATTGCRADERRADRSRPWLQLDRFGIHSGYGAGHHLYCKRTPQRKSPYPLRNVKELAGPAINKLQAQEQHQNRKQRVDMSILRIEHGISCAKRTKLQAYLDQTIADDIASMAEYTNNEQHYIVKDPSALRARAVRGLPEIQRRLLQTVLEGHR
jgi:hypothetical protein